MEIPKFDQDFLDKYSNDIPLPYSDFIEKTEEIIKDASNESKDLTKEFSAPKQNVAAVLQNKFKHPASLNYALRTQFGNSWLDWEPETIEKTINDVLAIKIDEFDKNMIGALKSLFNSSKFFNDYRVFGWTIYAFNQHIPQMDIIPKPHPGMLLDTYASTTKIRPGIYKDEVYRYINELIKEYGVKGIPKLLNSENITEESNSNIKSYLNTENENKIESILNYLGEDNKEYILKTIGMIDYYMARLKLARSQLNKLRQ